MPRSRPPAISAPQNAPEPGEPDDTFIDMHMALVSVPSIGKSLLGEAEYQNLMNWLDEASRPFWCWAAGPIALRDRVMSGRYFRPDSADPGATTRCVSLISSNAGWVRWPQPMRPALPELDIFKIPADAEFDPAEPFRLQLLVQRAVGAVEKPF